MSLDRRSFRIGVVAGTFLIIGIVSGVFLSAGRGWMSDAVSAPVAVPAAPVTGNGSGFAPVAPGLVLSASEENLQAFTGPTGIPCFFCGFKVDPAGARCGVCGEAVSDMAGFVHRTKLSPK